MITVRQFLLTSTLDGTKCLGKFDECQFFFCWSLNIGISTCRIPLENVIYELIISSTAVATMCCSFYFDGVVVYCFVDILFPQFMLAHY